MENKSGSRKNKHLTQSERTEIQECLDKRMSFKAIGKLLGKDPTTISYEVKHHRKELRNTFVRSSGSCPELVKAPFVCNGCKKRHSSSCPYVRFLYQGVEAQKEYKELLTSSREGVPLCKEEFYRNDCIVSAGVAKGQHIYHILKSNKDVTWSRSSTYRYVKRGYCSFSVLDLPRAVKFKERKKKGIEYVPAAAKKGHLYNDFLAFMEEQHLEVHTELDTVIGRIGGKVIMTIHFTSCNFMVGLLLDNKSQAEGAAKFAAFKNTMRSAGIDIAKLMGVLLCDNGGEFSNVAAYENDNQGNHEISLYFCDPMHSSQKPQIEKNHTLFRDIVPKGESFDDFTQDTVNQIFSHVNSVCRSLYGGKSAYDMFSFFYGENIASLMGIKKIPPEDVVQSPLLLKKIMP